MPHFQKLKNVLKLVYYNVVAIILKLKNQTSYVIFVYE
jgi:hypothetical protein